MPQAILRISSAQQLSFKYIHRAYCWRALALLGHKFSSKTYQKQLRQQCPPMFLTRLSHTHTYTSTYSLRWHVEHTQDCALIPHGCTSTQLHATHAPNHSSPSSWPTAQGLSLRILRTFFWAIENLSCKTSHLLDPQRRLFDLCFAWFLFATQHDSLLYCFTCTHMTVYWYILLLRKKTPQYNLLFLTMLSIPECLYTPTTMVNNYGLLSSLTTTAFFLPKAQKNPQRDERLILLTIKAHCI